MKNVLASVGSRNINHDTILDMHLNTNSQLSLARNILVLKVISSPKFNSLNSEDLNYLWDLWYNASWPQSTVVKFLDDVKELIQLNFPEELLFSLNDKEMSELKSTFNGWLSFI